jgi:fluoroacetyl-CoA thioesterase
MRLFQVQDGTDSRVATLLSFCINIPSIALKKTLKAIYFEQKSMEDRFIVGAVKERQVRVSSTQTTSFLWEGENVFSTPSMIAEMEETCRLMLKEQFIPEADSDSVGTLVNVRHLAATPVGAVVLLTAKIIESKNRKVTFEVEASDKIEKIGEGIHERVVINIPKFKAKFNEKLTKLSS